MNNAQLALSSVKGIDRIIMAGRGLHADLARALTSISAHLSIEDAPTLSLNFKDPRRVVLNSGVFGSGMILRLDGYPFELVQCAKNGTEMACTFEHEASVALRSHAKPLNVKAGTMTHVQFAKRLVSEERWLQFVTGGAAVRANNSLTRGQPGQPESSWDALIRNAGDRGWRVFVRGPSQIWYVPDSYLTSRPVYATLTPGKGGVQDIDFDYDIGKPVAEATVTADTGRWQIPPGEHIALAGVGPANGSGWIVSTIDRDLFRTTATITLVKPQPVLPEPKKETTGSSSSSTGSSSSVASSGPVAAGAVGGGTRATVFVNVALGQRGKPDQRGGDGSSSFDVAGLVEWALQQCGVAFPATAGSQYAACQKAGTLISLSRAEHVKGALLFEGVTSSDLPGRLRSSSKDFTVQNAVISLGDGRTIEARGRTYGLNEFTASGRPWVAAGLVPGLVY